MGNEAVEPRRLDVDAWDAWSPAEAQRHLDGVDTPWYVAAGWALDLFLGQPTRAHADLEIGVPADRFGEVRAALHDLEFVVIGEGQAGGTSPDVGVRASRRPVAHRRLPRALEGRRLDLRQRSTNPYACGGPHLIHGRRDPVRAAEVVLLLKARAPRAKDETDFATVLPHLNADQRRWLRDALALVRPGHAWIEVLKEP